MAQVSVLVADDHEIVRTAVVGMLERQPGIYVVGQAQDGNETVRLVKELHPDVVLLDVFMPGQSGLEALKELSEGRHPSRVLLLTAGLQPEEVAAALALGARGVVLKGSSVEALLNAIRTVMAGGLWLGEYKAADLARGAEKFARTADSRRPAFGLTPREREVLAAIASGAGNKDIAQKLGVSDHTVKHHLRSIFDKTGTSTRLELALFAIKHELASL